ncbi:MAG: hypothetical protein AAF581_18005 [Planctomycetota bacterium]
MLWHRVCVVVAAVSAASLVHAQEYELVRELTGGAVLAVSADAAVAVSPDGSRVAVADAGYLVVRDPDLAKTRMKLKASSCGGLCYGGNGRIYASHQDGTIACYDIKKKRRVWQTSLAGVAKGARFALSLSPDHQRLLVVGNVRGLFDAESGKLLGQDSEAGLRAWFLAGPNRFAIAATASKLQFFEVGQRFHWTPNQEINIPKVTPAAANGGSVLGVSDKGIYLLDPAAKGAQRVYKAKKSYTLRPLALRLKDGWLLQGDKRGPVCFWLDDEFQEVAQFSVSATTLPLAASENGHTVVLSGTATISCLKLGAKPNPLAGIGAVAPFVQWHPGRGVEAFAPGVVVQWHPEGARERLSRIDTSGALVGDPLLGRDKDGTYWLDPESRRKVRLSMELPVGSRASAGGPYLLIDVAGGSSVVVDRRTGASVRTLAPGAHSAIGASDRLFRVDGGKLICETAAEGTVHWEHATAATSLHVSERGDRLMIGAQLLATGDGSVLTEFPSAPETVVFSYDGLSLVLGFAADEKGKGMRYQRVDLDSGTIAQLLALPEPELTVTSIDDAGKYLIAAAAPPAPLDAKGTAAGSSAALFLLRRKKD